MTALRTILLLLLALLSAAGGAAWGAGRLVAQDVELGAEPYQVALMRWQGRPAVSVFTILPQPNTPGQHLLHVVALDPTGWHELGRWLLPETTVYVEPMRLPGGASGWLVLTGTQWQIAWAAGNALALRPLCACDTIYSHGGAPDSSDSRFVYDLDGDGIDEVVLPYSSHLEAYRITPASLAPEPLWRVRWHPDETGLPLSGQPGEGFRLPHFAFADLGGGHPGLLVAERERLLVTALPPPQAALSFALDGPRRALLEQRTSAQPLPATLADALRRLGDRRFPSAETFLGALAQGLDATTTEPWSPFLLRVLMLARSEVPVLRPAAAALEGLGSFGEQDEWRLLGLTDMDGDGVPDLLHAKLLNAGSALRQKNELRWYRGHYENGQFSLAPPVLVVRSDAGSFAKIERPRRDDKPPLVLLMATTEVNFGSIMKALTTQSVTLTASIVPWQDGAPAPQPTAARVFTYTDLRAKGRRAMFLFADLNGDGWRDYVLNVTPGTLNVYLSAGAPPALQEPGLVQPGLPLPPRPDRVLIADMDGDGHEELVLAFRTDSHPELASKLRLLRYLEQ
jgi:FG-GAP-like repeat